MANGGSSACITAQFQRKSDGNHMTDKLNITRRDFINGFAISLAAGTSLSPVELLALQGNGADAYYPPSLTGLRGSHPGSFEVAHALA